jgi:hypothetical protein
LPKLDNLKRIAIRKRAKNRPKQPAELGFVMQNDFLPDDFLLSHISTDGHRHIVFATKQQLALLAIKQHLCRFKIYYQMIELLTVSM